MDGPGVERTITLTDAVVAIAMTLLILPLVEVSGGLEFHGLSSFLAEHGNLVLSFVISFAVIYAFWLAHGAVYHRLAESGSEDASWLGLLNMFWLLVIAFLPFPTALVGRNLDTSTAPVYLGTMLVLSALTSGMAVVASRAGGDRRINFAWVTTAVFAICTVVSFFAADLAMYLLLVLVLVRAIEVRLVRRRAPAA